MMGPGPQGGAAFKTGQGSVCANKPLRRDQDRQGPTRSWRSSQTWTASRQEVDASSSGEREEKTAALSVYLRGSGPPRLGSRGSGLVLSPRALSTPDSDDASLVWHLHAMTCYRA